MRSIYLLLLSATIMCSCSSFLELGKKNNTLYYTFTSWGFYEFDDKEQKYNMLKYYSDYPSYIKIDPDSVKVSTQDGGVFHVCSIDSVIAYVDTESFIFMGKDRQKRSALLYLSDNGKNMVYEAVGHYMVISELDQ